MMVAKLLLSSITGGYRVDQARPLDDVSSYEMMGRSGFAEESLLLHPHPPKGLVLDGETE